MYHVYSPWTFAKWGMDVLGLFNPRKGQVKFLIIGVDYFMEWIEVQPLATITTKKVQQFVWKNIIWRYGVPHTIVKDNERQFIHKELANFVEHLQCNGQAEVSNKVILVELKKRLDSSKGRWPEELLEILWAYRCSPQSSAHESPFVAPNPQPMNLLLVWYSPQKPWYL